jgi:hypothetical protein
MTAHMQREGYDLGFVSAFFSMVDRRRRIHQDLLASYAGNGPYLASTIPYAAEVERMGLHRAPLGAFGGNSEPARAFGRLWEEARARIGFAPLVQVQAVEAQVQLGL